MHPKDRIGTKAHRFRLSPTAEQAAQLERAAGARRYVYNWALERWRDHYSAHGSSPPRGHLSSELTRLKRNGELAWLRDLPAQLPQQAIFDLERAFRAFFNGRSGYPRFRAKKASKATFRIPQNVRLDGHMIYLPKIGWIRARISRPVGADLGGATVSRTPDGLWFIAINDRFILPEKRPIELDSVLGIDVGLTDVVVCHDGRRIAAPRFARRSQRALRLAHRRYSRTQRGSAGREQARLALARTHRRVANRRQDFLHKLSTGVVGENDAVALETLTLSALARTKLGRSFGDAALGELHHQLRYKAMWLGKTTISVDRFFPSTKRCSACHRRDDRLSLSDRSWRCGACGAQHDRDINAAINLRDEGIRQLLLRDRGAHGHDQRPWSLQKTPTGGSERRSGNRDPRGCQTGSILVSPTAAGREARPR